MAERVRVSSALGRRVLLATVLGSGIVFLDTSVSSTALPAIQRDLGLTTAQQQWIASGYLLTLSALLLVGGRLGDLFGRRRLFVWGLSAYAALSVVAAAAPTAELLIAARSVQGVAGAMLVPTSLAIVSATFSDDERGRAIGVWSAWSGISTILGPLAGGLAIDRATWRLAFLIGPVLALFALWIARGMPESRDESADRRLDFIGVVLVALAVGGPVYALIQGPILGWRSVHVLGGALGGAVALPAFLLWEARAPAPMLPLGIFRNRNLAAANVTTLLLYAGLYGGFFYIGLYVQSTLGFPAVIAGGAFVPITLLLFFLSPYAGRLNDRFGPRWLMTFGPITAGAGLALAGFTREPGQLWTVLLPGIVLFGIGMGFTVAPLVATAIGSAEERYAGVASGLNNAVSRFAALLAIAALGAVALGLWQGALDVESRSATLSDEGRTALSEVRDKAFVLPKGKDAEALADRAAEVAFQRAMLLAAALAVSGGLVSAAFIRGGGAPTRD